MSRSFLNVTFELPSHYKKLLLDTIGVFMSDGFRVFLLFQVMTYNQNFYHQKLRFFVMQNESKRRNRGRECFQRVCLLVLFLLEQKYVYTYVYELAMPVGVERGV